MNPVSGKFNFRTAVSLVFLIFVLNMVADTTAAMADIGSQQQILAANAQAEANFGWSVSISNDLVIIGAPNTSIFLQQQGAAYLFSRTGTNTWDCHWRLFLLDDINDFDHFGTSVSIDSGHGVAGASGFDERGSAAGAVFRFYWGHDYLMRSSTTTGQDTEAGDLFGGSVAMSGVYTIVGAKNEGALYQGAAYIFSRAGGTWDTGYKIVDPDGQADDYFGTSVAISGDYAVVGVPFNDLGGDRAGAVLHV